METSWKIKIKKNNMCKFSSFLIMSNWEKYLKDIYLDLSHPASFDGPDRLYKIVKKEGKHKISHSQTGNRNHIL